MGTRADKDARGLFEEQITTLGWTYEDALADVGGAEWALRTVAGPPIRLFIAGLKAADATVVQAKITVSPEHRRALRQMADPQRRQVAMRLHMMLLGNADVEPEMTSQDGKTPDHIEMRYVVHGDQLSPVEARRALRTIRNMGLKVIALIQDGVAGHGEHGIQQISVDPKAASGTYDDWEANMVVVSGGCMAGLDRLRQLWQLPDVGQVVERLLEQHDNQS